MFGFRGGVECGFLSATTSRSVALQYGEGGYLISLTTSLASRGASLKPFSYYPEEDVSQSSIVVLVVVFMVFIKQSLFDWLVDAHVQEVCLPPCVAMDVGKGCRMDKQAVVVDVAVVRVIVILCVLDCVYVTCV